MLTRLKTLASLYHQLGPRWTLFRLLYAFRLRTGLTRLQMPMGKWEDYKNHISNKPAGRVERAFFPLVSRPSDLPENISWNKQTAVDEADRILKGEIKYFSHQFHQVGFPPNWHNNPVSNLQSPTDVHWSQISDDYVVARSPQGAEAISNHEETASAKNKSASQRHGDIKFIWEPNRFAFVYTLVRAYAATDDEKYPTAFWTLIEDWAEHNPPNTGPNWMDGQEIALRLMAWTFGFGKFSNSPSSTPDRKAKFILLVAAQAERIYKNIGYAISTRSNHTISEAFGLWLVGLLFPELKHAEKYLSLGKRLLEQEAKNQIFPDGSYSMYSLNYHRFILHIYLYAIQLAKLHNFQFSNSLHSSISSSIEFLSHLINPQTGEMPVYGSNDGALVLRLNNCAFTDYRPLLQLGWYITKGERLFEPGPWDEDLFWLCGTDSLSLKGRGAGVRVNGEKKEERRKNLSALSVLRGESFPNGGVYLLRQADSHALIHCTDYTSRPSHADQLHVDLWIHGHELAIDAGTYLYSGQDHWRNGLAHTNVHNTVTVDGKDQMTMVSRFTWTNWSKGKVLKHDKNLWQGEHDGYKPVSHMRTVMALEEDRWLVIDKLEAKESHRYALQWLLADSGVQELAPALGLLLKPSDGKPSDSRVKIQMGLLEGDGNFSIVRADSNSTRGWRSKYYGHKEPAISVMLEANQPQITFWSFFGFENDDIEVVGNELKVNSKIISLVERRPEPVEGQG
ncbi:MAG: alginate lyase family protein [Anaerolineales bacterium]|nr:MAG: alginate lyase family protein [Anaerolineales bacterium]